MGFPANLLTLIGDLAEEWATGAGVPILYAGLATRDLGELVIILDAPTLDYTESPACDAGPSAVTLDAHLVTRATDDLSVTDLYARAIPIIAALPDGWRVETATPESWPASGESGAPSYRIALSYS